MPNSTNVLDIDSELVRKQWLKDKLVAKVSQSFWAPYVGMGSENIVYQVNTSTAGDGHTVVFDYAGQLSGKGIKGKNTAYGNGEDKRKYSDKINVDRYRFPVNNGDKFDAINAGDLGSAEHSDSVNQLGDLWTRFKDQALFDAGQGGLGDIPTHIFSTTAGDFDFDALLELEKAVKTGRGFKKPSATGAVTTNVAETRSPLKPFKLIDGKPIWLLVLDSAMATALKASDKYQSLMFNGDLRGNDNRAITGVIGKIGSFVIVEADTFFGTTDGAGSFGLEDSEVEFSGLRQYMTDGTIDTTTPLQAWSGQETFSDTTPANVMSRGLVLGAGALQLGMGKEPEYLFQDSVDFGITSESALEIYTGVKQTRLSQETGKGKNAKITEIPFGLIAVDMQTN